jgi:hypothetical protein
MNKLGWSLMAILLLSFSVTSCKYLKRKTSKKEKAAALKTKQMADSISLSIKTDLNNADSLIKNKVEQDSAQLIAQVLLTQSAPIWQRKIEFTTMSAKAKMHYEGGDKSLDFVANIRMHKDSIIWVSVTVAGIVQVARAIITPDSFKAVLYTEKEAYEGPISLAHKILPEGINFYSLQNLLIGNPILRNQEAISATQDSENWIIRFVEKNYIEQVQYKRSDSSLYSNQLLMQGSGNQSLTQLLSNFGLVNNLNIATDRKLSIITDTSTMLVDMNYSNITINSELTYPFSIPKNYTIK